MAMVIKYFDIQLFKFQTKLYRLIEPVSCTGKELFNSLVSAFENQKINITEKCIGIYILLVFLFTENLKILILLGFASDNTNAMVGKHNSVVSRLKEIIPNIIVFGYICHTSDLISSNAAKKIPTKYEDFTRDVHNFFGNRFHYCN